MSRDTVWRARPATGFAARVGALAVVVGLLAAGVALELSAFEGSDLGARLAWLPVVLAGALPTALIVTTVAAWAWGFGGLCKWRLEFSGQAPSRAGVAWRMRTPRLAERAIERVRHQGITDDVGGAADIVASVITLERRHPAVRARLDAARPCAALLAEQLGLSAEEERFVDWLVAIRFACDVAGRGELERCVEEALVVVPGALLDGPQSRRAASLAAVACEFGVLTAARPHGLGERRREARGAILEVARGRMSADVVEAFAGVPAERLEGAVSPTRPVRPIPARWAWSAALAWGSAAALVVAVTAVAVGGGGRDGEREPDVLGVVEGNRPPVARDDRAKAEPGSTVEIEVLANDSDPDGDAVRVLRWDAPVRGRVVVVDGVMRYTAESEGGDRFEYVVGDDAGAEATAAVVVEVRNAP